jgi:hypothetical protein
MVKSIIFSIEPINDRTKGASAKGQATQLGTSIIHIRGSALGVAAITPDALCALGPSVNRRSERRSTSGEWGQDQHRVIRSPAIRYLGRIAVRTG